jgi:heme-degrading monooxygenase HmoA
VLQLKPLDENVPIFQQIGTEAQPGYISTQLHQGIAGSTVLMNYAIWESVAHFRAAFTHPDFKQALSHYPSSAVASPHLFTRLTVPNLCVGP